MPRGTFKKGHKHSIETKRKIGEANERRIWSEQSRAKLRKIHHRENNANWRGGIRSKNLLIRNSQQYQLWRKAVFERDDYICCGCGQRGGKLEAHHILSFAGFPHKRFDISNGQTLCIDCHKKVKRNGGRYY